MTPNKLEIQEQEERKRRAKEVKKPILQTAKQTKKPRAAVDNKTSEKLK